ncbi:MAG: DEAD/DEAH box helicase [Planctomycetota bacterium]
MGPKRAEAFEKVLGVRLIEQLLRILPRRYEGIPLQYELSELDQHEGEIVRLRGTVLGCSIWGRGRRSVLQVKLQQGDTTALALFFNQAYRRKQFVEGKELWLEAKVSTERGLKLIAPKNVVAEEAERQGLRAVYSDYEGLPKGAVRRAMVAAAEWMSEVPEPLPDSILALADVPSLPQALQILHAPASEEDAQGARRRLAFGEMLAMEVRRQRGRAVRLAYPIEEKAEVWERILSRIPFELNPEQMQVLALMRTDLASGEVMGRLLHGEVGSGKTAVAFALALLIAADGGQVALMAPTELLARQHLKTFRAWLKGSRLHVVGLLGDDGVAARRQCRVALRGGTAQIAIGTHALFSKDVAFRDLRLVVFDEQHRFGVRQKAALVAKGDAPHVLTMTATPIPRTLAWAQYGALEPCVLRARAGAGASIVTRVLAEAQWREEAEKVRVLLEQGQRCFVVVPRIDGEEGLHAWAERFFQGPWKGISHRIVHGRLPGAEVEAAVEDFRKGKSTVLCGTTVVEVGIDVAGVEHMFLLGGERLGLASIHQLRGRLARGAESADAECRIFSASEASQERLMAMESCHDGFAVAALDLRERGPGALVGTRQHGASGFSAFDPLRDDDLVQQLRSQELRNWIADQE